MVSKGQGEGGGGGGKTLCVPVQQTWKGRALTIFCFWYLYRKLKWLGSKFTRRAPVATTIASFVIAEHRKHLRANFPVNNFAGMLEVDFEPQIVTKMRWCNLHAQRHTLRTPSFLCGQIIPICKANILHYCLALLLFSLMVVKRYMYEDCFSL